MNQKAKEEKQPPPLPSVEVLLFEAPLYTRYKLDDDLELARRLYGQIEEFMEPETVKVDGYCPKCQKDTTYNLLRISYDGQRAWKDHIPTRHSFDTLYIRCGREDWHVITYYFRIDSLVVQKVGQWPSLADIAIDETRQKYKSVLRGKNWAELYKAIGLATHGEGIGSFVYLRRVFERLIQSRFDEFKESEGWSEEEFQKLRVAERIGFLKGHLPAFLVENKQLYSIFSQGIHELDNDVCLRFFDVGKRSIIMILEDDLKTKADLAARREIAEAVKTFSPSFQVTPASETPGS